MSERAHTTCFELKQAASHEIILLITMNSMIVLLLGMSQKRYDIYAALLQAYVSLHTMNHVALAVYGFGQT